eukprot:m.335832 g.335832  ORF g.335832 m.335832 type:complete len:400 (+) comp17688_c0_seq1:155-1354(+)
MVKYVLPLLATLACVQAKSVLQYSKCLVAAENNHPEIDLNPLMSGTDHIFVSKSGSKYAYHLNICGQTNFQDSKCDEGGSICEVEDSNTGLDVYGYLDSMELKWDNDDLVMTMTGEEQCPFFKSKPYTSTIVFECDQDESFTVTKEDYYKCDIAFLVKTPAACGSSGSKYKCNTTSHQCSADENGQYPNVGDCLKSCQSEQHYVCVDQKCEEKSGSGGFPSLADCEAECATSHKFSCDLTNHMCSEAAGGKYSSITECAKDCKSDSGLRYECNQKDYTCAQATEGTYKNQSDCQRNCAPFVKHYRCFNNRCEHDSKGQYPSLQTCMDSCGNPVETWACGPDNTCTEDDKGSFKTEQDCAKSCGSSLYVCNWNLGTCEKSDHGISNQTLCNSICTKSNEQ